MKESPKFAPVKKIHYNVDSKTEACLDYCLVRPHVPIGSNACIVCECFMEAHTGEKWIVCSKNAGKLF